MKLRITVQGTSYDVDVQVLEDGGSAAVATTPAPAASAPAAHAARPSGGGRVVNSPIPGTIIAVNVQAGQQVQVNQPLLSMEAMKMESNVSAPVAGVIGAVLVKPGQAVTQGQPLVRID